MTKSKLANQLQNTLLVLKQRQGASLAQIRKRLKISNSNDVGNKRLSHTLNSLVQQGMVKKQPKGLYKLASNTPAEEDQKEMVPHRRRRALPHGPCKRHRMYHKLRSRKAHRHRRRRRRHSRRRRRHSRRRRRSFPIGYCKTHRRTHKRRR